MLFSGCFSFTRIGGDIDGFLVLCRMGHTRLMKAVRNMGMRMGGMGGTGGVRGKGKMLTLECQVCYSFLSSLPLLSILVIILIIPT